MGLKDDCTLREVLNSDDTRFGGILLRDILPGLIGFRLEVEVIHLARGIRGRKGREAQNEQDCKEFLHEKFFLSNDDIFPRQQA